MSMPLGNTPGGGGNAPDELQTPGLVWLGQAPDRKEPPVIMFYRTVEHGQAFAPDSTNIDTTTGQPKLVYPVTIDIYFPNGPLAGRVYRRIGFINQGLTQPIRKTPLGSINVGQLAAQKSRQGNMYPQLNALDPDALAWATQIHQAAGGNVFRHYDPQGEAGAPAAQAAPTAQAPAADRFAGMPVPGAAPAAPQGPPAGMPGAGGPPPGFAPAAAMTGGQFVAAAAPAVAHQLNGQALAPAAQGQPQPTTVPPPPGVPPLGAGASQGPPAGMPGQFGPPPGFPPAQG